MLVKAETDQGDMDNGESGANEQNGDRVTTRKTADMEKGKGGLLRRTTMDTAPPDRSATLLRAFGSNAPWIALRLKQ